MSEIYIPQYIKGLIAGEVTYIPQFDNWSLIDRKHHWPAFEYSQKVYQSLVPFKDTSFGEIKVWWKFKRGKRSTEGAYKQGLIALRKSNGGDISGKITQLGNNLSFL